MRDVATAGERTSLNLTDVAVESVSRGEQVVEPGRLEPSQILTVELQLLPDCKPLKHQARIRFHHFSAELLSQQPGNGLRYTGGQFPGGKQFYQDSISLFLDDLITFDPVKLSHNVRDI